MGIFGQNQQRTGAMGVAKNGGEIALPYSLIALNPHDCGANKITGSPGTAVTTNGTVHIDSDCTTNPGALQLSGNGVLSSPQCDVVGLIVEAGGATNDCTSAPAGVLVYGDPLRNSTPRRNPERPFRSSPSTSWIPARFPPRVRVAPTRRRTPLRRPAHSPRVSMAGKSYRIFPGNYPGGISTSKATLYMDPGIYWIGGSGVQIQSTGAMISKAPGDNTGDAPSGGVLIYNAADPIPTSGCAAAGCYGPISINGGGGDTPTLALEPMEDGDYKGMVIFVDREEAAAYGGIDIDLNGENSVLNVTGTIYAPTASVQVQRERDRRALGPGDLLRLRGQRIGRGLHDRLRRRTTCSISRVSASSSDGGQSATGRLAVRQRYLRDMVRAG